MKIRTAQMQILQQSLVQRFAKVLSMKLRSDFPEQTSAHGDPSLLERVESAIVRARSYGLWRDKDVTAFVRLTVVIAPNFDRHRPINEVLTSTDIADEEKVSVLFASVSEFEWALAAFYR